MTLKEMRERLEYLATQARKLLDEANAEGLTEERAAELEAQADAAFKEYDDLTRKIEREEHVLRMQQTVADMQERANRPDPSRRPGAGGGEAPGSDVGEQVDYRTAFHAYLRSQGQLADMRPEERAVLESGYAQVPQDGSEARAQTTTAAAGGYTIPEEMMELLVRSMAAWGPMYDDEAVATVINTEGGNPMPFPTVDDTGVTAAASAGEGVTLTDDGGKDVTFGEKQLDAYSFDTEWIRVSLELAQDSFLAMEQLLSSLLGERLGRLANSQLTVGTGSSAPNGVVTASSLGKTAASATAITWDELLDLEHSVDPAYRSGPKVAWMMNDSTLLAIRKLKDGQGNYLWQMGNVQSGIPPMINDRRYHINQAMAAIATGNRSVLFGDLGKYYVRKVGAPLIGAIQDKDFWPGFGVAGWIRFDGELGDAAAVKHLIQA